jgi:hypothetical protein
MFLACIGFVSCCVLPTIPLDSVKADIPPPHSAVITRVFCTVTYFKSLIPVRAFTPYVFQININIILLSLCRSCGSPSFWVLDRNMHLYLILPFVLHVPIITLTRVGEDHKNFEAPSCTVLCIFLVLHFSLFFFWHKLNFIRRLIYIRLNRKFDRNLSVILRDSGLSALTPS